MAVALVPLAGALLAGGCGDGDVEETNGKSTPVKKVVSGEATYVGSKSCVECHKEEYHDWQGSHHDLAMDLATEETVLGDFDDTSFKTKFGIESKMSRRDGKFFIATEGPSGKTEEFEVKYVFGVDPLQQYMVEFPDGRVQVWTVAWDTNRKAWFDLQKNEPEHYPPGDPMHWTGWGNTWNHMCADCHSTNLERHFDLAKNEYHTSFSEIDVSCEACHGPASVHLELAETKNWSTDAGYGLVKLKGKDPTTQLETCAKCHSHHGIVHHGFEPGKSFDDHYALSLLDSELYYPDGQIQEEAYVYGSFLQSRMFREGVRCTDCHDPHSLKPKRPGNQLCTKCHTPEKYDSTTHHFHKAGTDGASCVECHMPERHYMVVDPRRDHNIRVPRPDISVKLGTPNACTKCHLEIKNEHKDKWPLYQDWLAAARDGNADAKREIERLDQWAADVIVEKYGPKRREDPHFADTIQGARQGLPTSEKDLIRLSSSKKFGPVVRASAVALLRNYSSLDSAEAVIAATKDEDPRVRAAAVAALPPDALVAVLPEMLEDENRLVRHEATRLLSLVPFEQFPEDLWPEYRRALQTYKKELAPSADTWQMHVNLGGVLANLGEIDDAEYHFRKALEINKVNVPALQGLTQILLRKKRTKEAERLWREHLESAPDSVDGHFNLGLLIAESSDRLEEATKHLKKATEVQPEYARAHYNYGLALQKLGKLKEAEESLRRAYQLAPYAQDYVVALVAFYQQQKQPEKSEKLLLASVRREPMPLGIAMMLVNFYAQQEKWSKADAAIRDAIKRAPKSPNLLQYAMMFYAQQGELDKAKIYAEQLVDVQPENQGARQTLDQLRRLIDRRDGRG